jgi:hypothetical protein
VTTTAPPAIRGGVRASHESGARESNAVFPAPKADGLPSPSLRSGPTISAGPLHAIHCGVLKIQLPPAYRGLAQEWQDSNLQRLVLETSALSS